MNILDKIKNLILPKSDEDAHEFRPLLSEIEERPLNPIGNTIFWLIIIFIIINRSTITTFTTLININRSPT